MTKTLKFTYCRACGEGKGHTTPNCKNHKALLAIIGCQDSELGSVRHRLEIAEEQAADSKLLTETAQKTEAEWQRQARFLLRVCTALLNALEAK